MSFRQLAERIENKRAELIGPAMEAAGQQETTMLYDPKWKVPTETKPLEPWRKVLLAAATAIETHGHAKNTMRIEGRMCALGAMEFACRKMRCSIKVDYQAWKALKRIVGSGNIAD